jgi:hypothetical protein
MAIVGGISLMTFTQDMVILMGYRLLKSVYVAT